MKSTHVMRGERGGLPSILAVLAIAVILLTGLLFPAAASAVSIEGTSRTYALSRETSGSQNILGLYEYLDLDVQSIGRESISFHSGGWFRYDLGEEQAGRKTNNDLQYAYLSFRSAADNTTMNLGRILVFEGVAAERVDGVYTRTDLQKDFSISAFAGVPVETEFGAIDNDLIYGARLSHQKAGLYQAGLSYLAEEDGSIEFREQAGFDLWLHPFSKVDIAGRSNYNYVSRGWMDNTYNLVLGPFDRFRFTTEASWIDYASYFQGATTAAFRLQAGFLDPTEKVRRLSELVSASITDKLTLVASYRTYDYRIAGNATSYGAQATYAASLSDGVGLSYNKMDGSTNRLQYVEYRIFGYKKFGKTDIAIDLLDIKYDQAINSVSNVYSASLAAQYELLQDLTVGADIEYQKNPDFKKDVRAFLKAIYRFDIGSGARKGA